VTTYLNKDEITKLIHDNGLFHGSVSIGIVMDMNHIEKFANLIAEAEREACAKLCEDLTAWHSKTVIAALDSAAENIRARSLDVHN